MNFNNYPLISEISFHRKITLFLSAYIWGKQIDAGMDEEALKQTEGAGSAPPSSGTPSNNENEVEKMDDQKESSVTLDEDKQSTDGDGKYIKSKL